MNKTQTKIIYKGIDDLIPYVNNSRTHSEEQVLQIASSIKEFGFNNPILIDGENGIIAGHGRVQAAKKLNLKTVPCIELSHLSEAQKKAYVIADNKIALNAGWDFGLLKLEIEDLKDFDFDIDLLGFDEVDLEFFMGEESGPETEPVDDIYTKKITTPIYEIKGDKPELSELLSNKKSESLITEIEGAEIPQDIKDFLIKASFRHIVFDYERIAEFYAHADRSTQELMEKSALVIIDFNQAIENGYVELTKAIMEGYSNDS